MILGQTVLEIFEPLTSAIALSENAFAFHLKMPASKLSEQGHHHNGDQTVRRPHMMCSICGRQFTTPRFGVRGDQGWADSIPRTLIPISSPLYDTYGLSLTVFELFSWIQKLHFRPPVRPSDADTIPNTALEATASSIGKKSTHFRVFFATRWSSDCLTTWVALKKVVRNTW